jgi:chloramphenicol O-acetyltransferase type A
MSGYLDIEAWNRRRQFEFFRDYENPFFNICANLDVTRLWRLTRVEKDISFFIAYHFFSIKAANQVEPFRYRLRGDRVFVHDRIHAGTTLLLADENFTFVYFDYTEDFADFQTRAKAAVERAKAGGSRLDEREDRDDLIYHSVIPWVTFTSISHAREGRGFESGPNSAFGK